MLEIRPQCDTQPRMFQRMHHAVPDRQRFVNISKTSGRCACGTSNMMQLGCDIGRWMLAAAIRPEKYTCGAKSTPCADASAVMRLILI